MKLVHHMTETLHSTHSPAVRPMAQATADLTTIAFYYLLRVGEYTQPPTDKRRNTHPFAVHNVTFWDAEDRIIPVESPWARLQQATAATITIPRQKTGRKGQSIHQQCTGLPTSPVKALARRVHHILSNGGPVSTPIYTVYDPVFFTHPQTVTPKRVNDAIRTAAGAIGLWEMGYQPRQVSSHSLRAGGAMALHLHGVDITTIKKLGRWTSKTFEDYIHIQISSFSSGLSVQMAHNIPFQQIAPPRHTRLNAP